MSDLENVFDNIQAAARDFVRAGIEQLHAAQPRTLKLVNEAVAHGATLQLSIILEPKYSIAIVLTGGRLEGALEVIRAEAPGDIDIRELN